MTKDRLAIEISGQTHSYTQVKTLFVYSRIKLSDKGGWLVCTAPHSHRVLQGESHLPLHHNFLQAMHVHLILKYLLQWSGPRVWQHRHSRAVQSPSPLLLHPSVYKSNYTFVHLCAGSHTTPMRWVGQASVSSHLRGRA